MAGIRSNRASGDSAGKGTSVSIDSWSDAGRFVLRPCDLSDLPALERFADASAHGVTTLPPDRVRLVKRIEHSMASFATDDVSGEETYLFVLDDLSAGATIGVSGIAAQAGFTDRFYSYRNEFTVHRSRALACSNRVHTLHLCHDLTGATLLTSFFIDPAYHDTLAPQLLSRARLLFIAQHAGRFSDRIASESPGLADGSGRCPFWDAVGRRFFGMDYPMAEKLAEGRSKAFMAELMPTSPVYVPLLSDEAQWAIGQLHPDAELPFSILSDEGFEADTYVDIFDGGPIATSKVSSLTSVRGGEAAAVLDASRCAPGTATRAILANTSIDGFRAALVLGSWTDLGLALHPEQLRGLILDHGDIAHFCDVPRTWGQP